MAGHSKWANIQHRKKAQDAKRGKVFTRLIRGIKIAARQGGPDPEANATLRNAIDTARAANMSKDVIERAIKSAVGDSDGDTLEELVYEGYGPGGVALLVECLTDNRNRTVSEVRHAFTKHGGNLGAAGSVNYLFNQRGVLSFTAENDEDRVMEIALDVGAEDVQVQESGQIEVMTSPENYLTVKSGFESAGLLPEYAEVSKIATTEIYIDGEDGESLIKLINMLEDLDDVQAVYNNADFSDELLANLT